VASTLELRSGTSGVSEQEASVEIQSRVASWAEREPEVFIGRRSADTDRRAGEAKKAGAAPERPAQPRRDADVNTTWDSALDGMLVTLDSLGGSDLHLRPGSSARARVHGDLRILPGSAVLSLTDVEQMVAVVVPTHLSARLATAGDADTSYTSAAGARFRAHAYHQRGEVTLVLRQGPRRSSHHGTAAPATRHPPPGRATTGPGAGVRADGLGQDIHLGAMVDHINRTRPVHIVTLEDPIEILHRDQRAWVSQREIGIDLPDFGTGMRAAVREDPDVIVVGEMRDRKTMVAALTAAETGHLVLSSLHTTDAVETVNRIVELFPDDQRHQIRLVLAETLRGTVCQRLVKSAGGTERVPAVEVMIVNGRVQRCILDPTTKEDMAEIVADSEFYGMQTFRPVAGLALRG
jgi:twitching motility protein PilT